MSELNDNAPKDAKKSWLKRVLTAKDGEPLPPIEPIGAKVEEPVEEVKPIDANDKVAWYKKMSGGLSRSSKSLSGGITGIFQGREIDDESLQDLEDLLIQADLGWEIAENTVSKLRGQKFKKDIATAVREQLAEEISTIVEPVAWPLEIRYGLKPHVILIVGVNGSGKTTTIGKLAQQYRQRGLKVMIGAADTFRAAAIDQLKVWGERSNVPVLTGAVGADPASVAYNALEQARSQRMDVLLVDTAGRLQNKADLMAELQKIVRVMGKIDDKAPHSTLLVLDATTGQNAHSQVEVFSSVCQVTGLIMTKLDGTARGGVLAGLAQKFKLPIHAIGIGEGIADLQPFTAEEYTRALVGLENFQGSAKADQKVSG